MFQSNTLAIATLFIIGTFVGSFANVIVYRLFNKEHGILMGRSKCPHCKKNLPIWDLIPILSYLMLGRKCRFCHKIININYFAGEITMGILFALIAVIYPVSLTLTAIIPLIYVLLVVFILFIVSFYDLYYQEIPDLIMIPAILIVLIVSFFDPTGLLTKGLSMFNMTSLPLYALIGSSIPFTFFLLQIIISRGKWIGGGDLRLGIFMGAVLGIKLGVLALILSYFIGTIISLSLLIFKRKNLKSTIPFGPFLSLGIFIALLWGEQIVNWYLSYLM